MAVKCMAQAATTRTWNASWYENTRGHSRGRLVTSITMPMV